MDIDKDNPIAIKTKAFALRIIKLYQYLQESKNEHTLSKQALRSGTSIGANVREALRGQSKADFGAKMNIALKEAAETEYWLELLHEALYIDDNSFTSINADLSEILSMLTSIVKTTFKTNDRK
ncbi:MAG: four helix bundle protein [Bacteroidaceae bacterium]|nr:four helix bundle protein [Bacteroidaceae bacterium]